MLNQQFKDHVVHRILPRVQTPAQYIGGEVNMVRKDHRSVRGRLCMAFPDTYTIGMSHHGLQVLYTLMNRRTDWACERVFTPWIDMEAELRRADVPLYSLETFTPLSQFDVLGFSLQYELCSSNVLTILDLGRIPLHGEQRSMADPLVIAGGPCAQNPEPMAPFIDVFVTGDGEPSLPKICDLWLDLKAKCRTGGGVAAGDLGAGDLAAGDAGREERERMLAHLAAALPFCYVPRFYGPEPPGDGAAGEGVKELGQAPLANLLSPAFPDVGREPVPFFHSLGAVRPTRSDVPRTIEPLMVSDLDAVPLPTHPIVPYVECVHDRIAIEIMRGCPRQCRFCQSSVIKRPLRFRSITTIVEAALESYRNSGFSEISLLSLSSSDYPHFEQLVRRLHEVFGPLGVNISVPSLRVNEQLRTIAGLIGNRRRSALTLAPEVARDDMREQIGKKIRNEDLYEGCRQAFRNRFESAKLYFMCGLPGERNVDLDGIVDMAETIARIGREERGRLAKVTASVSNFVPKAHTPYQWNVMQRREYFHWAHDYLRKRCRLRSVQIKCHDVETSLLEGVLGRGDRRVAAGIELAWRRGARLDAWTEQFDADRWWQALADAGIDVDATLHQGRATTDRLPWDHIRVPRGRTHLEKEHHRSAIQLKGMSDTD